MEGGHPISGEGIQEGKPILITLGDILINFLLTLSSYLSLLPLSVAAGS